jgi:hypothetical protein
MLNTIKDICIIGLCGVWATVGVYTLRAYINAAKWQKDLLDETK